MIQINETAISDCVVLYPDVKTSDIGVSAELYKICALTYFVPKQVDYSNYKCGTLYGIHQSPYAKLITCLSGKVYSVCVDLRPDSETYTEYYKTNLDSEKLNSLYVPPNCGHALFATTDCLIICQQDDVYDRKHDNSFCWCDPTFNIIWPVLTPSVISERDKTSCENILKNVLKTPKPSI